MGVVKAMQKFYPCRMSEQAVCRLWSDLLAAEDRIRTLLRVATQFRDACEKYGSEAGNQSIEWYGGRSFAGESLLYFIDELARVRAELEAENATAKLQMR